MTKKRTIKQRMGQLYPRFSWMRAACNNPSNPDWATIGARGIQCHWGRGQYREFETWVLKKLGPPQGDEKYLTRIDIDGDFAPGNLAWRSGREKANRPDGHSKLYRMGRRTQSLRGWAREYNINYATLWSRIQRGWTLKEAVK